MKLCLPFNAFLLLIIVFGGNGQQVISLIILTYIVTNCICEHLCKKNITTAKLAFLACLMEYNLTDIYCRIE